MTAWSRWSLIASKSRASTASFRESASCKGRATVRSKGCLSWNRQPWAVQRQQRECDDELCGRCRGGAEPGQTAICELSFSNSRIEALVPHAQPLTGWVFVNYGSKSHCNEESGWLFRQRRRAWDRAAASLSSTRPQGTGTAVPAPPQLHGRWPRAGNRAAAARTCPRSGWVPVRLQRTRTG